MTMKCRSGTYVLLLFLLFFFWPEGASPLSADERDAALRILDDWTSVRWGEDNLAWVVYYPEELVEPWVRSEAERRKFTAEQTEAYRKAFTDELKMGDATAVMLSIHAFGPNPLSLAPLAKNISLIDSSGKRVTPIVFEKRLDTPLSGLVQGFVFFPKQANSNFKIAVTGLVNGRETIFSFPNGAAGAIATQAPPGGSQATVPMREPAAKEVVVKIPTKKPQTPPKPAPPVNPAKTEEPDFSTETDVFKPTTPQAPPPAISPDTAASELPPVQPLVPQAPGYNARQALDLFLKSWIAGDTDRMYDLLSAESKEKISKELFARDVMGTSFRQALKSGYKVNWSGNSAKVTVAKKVLFMRTLESRQIRFVEEDGTNRVSW